MKKTETQARTLVDLAARCSEGKAAAERFTSLVRRVIRTPKETVDALAQELKESRAS